MTLLFLIWVSGALVSVVACIRERGEDRRFAEGREGYRS